MADLEITFASVSIPANTSVTLTVEEDPDTDGTFENSNSTGLIDGQTSYTLSGFDGSGDLRVSVDPDNTDDVSTAEIGEPVDVSTAATTQTIAGTVDTLTFSEPTASVTAEGTVSIAGTLDSLTFSEPEASINAVSITIDGTVDTLRFVEPQATVSVTDKTGYSTTITQLDGTVTDFNRMLVADLNLNHSALSEAIIEVVPEVTDPTDVALGDADIFLDGKVLFKGENYEVVEDSPTEGYATIEAVGPGYELTREAPSSEINYSNTSVYNAVNDYWNNQITNVSVDPTVSEPTPNFIEDDTQLENIPTQTSFSGEFDIANDVPAQFNNSEIQLEDHGFGFIESDFSGTYTAELDSSGDSYFHINGEFATLSSNGDNVFAQFEPNHDIPADRVAATVHYKSNTATSNVDDTDFIVNGVNLGFAYTQDEDPVTGNMAYAVFDSQEYSNNGGGQLDEGTQYTVEFTISDTADIEVDYLYVWDTKFGNPVYDEPDSFEALIEGPSFHPGDVELESIQHFENGNIQEARLETTWNDTSNEQRISLTNTDGDSYIHGDNQTNLTADFAGNDTYGAVLRSKIRLSGTDAGNGVWLSSGVTGQNIEEYNLFVTVTDTQIIDEITVRKNHFENLQELHQGEWRFVIDPTVRSPITVDAFRDGNTGSNKNDNWVTLSASKTRDVRDYGNQIKFIYNDTNGDRSEITIQRTEEVDAKSNTVIQIVEETTTQYTAREARIEAIKRLDDAIAIDKTTGNIEAWAKLILPGYEYTVDEWGIDSSIERVRYSESSENATMTLQFVKDRDVTAQVIQNI